MINVIVPAISRKQNTWYKNKQAETTMVEKIGLRNINWYLKKRIVTS